MALVITIAQVIYVFFGVGVACELGERSSGIFDAINDDIGKIDWYLYPIEIKRILPTIMIVTQKPIYVEFFGSQSVSRETFVQVCVTVYD